MFKNNWYFIDGFLFNDYLPIINILNAFLDSPKKRILFPFYFFSLDDFKEQPDDTLCTLDDLINNSFELFIEIAEPSSHTIIHNGDMIIDKVMNMLSIEYTRVTNETCSESIRKDLLERLLKDDLDLFDKSYIYSIKEFISSEINKTNDKLKRFIEERKVCENTIDASYRHYSMAEGGYSIRSLNYVWYEPKSKDELLEIINNEHGFIECVITEDICDFNNYLYAFEYLEQNDFVFAVNDRVGNFESIYVPKIKPYLRKENVIYNQQEYYRKLGFEI